MKKIKEKLFSIKSPSYNVQLILFLVPYLIGTMILVVVPVLISVGLSFTNYNALSPPTWAGLDNYKYIFSDGLTRVAVRNSLYFAVFAVLIRLLGALGLALLLHHRERFVGIYRMAVYLPTIIPEVAYALIWLWIFNPFFGPLNFILQSLGIEAVSWLVNPETARISLVFMMSFQLGEGFLILLAGRQAIPETYYEAIRLEGGGFLSSFRFVTFPLLLPWILLLLVRDTVISLQNVFTPAFIMTKGGPYYTTFFMPLLVYEEAFDRYRFGVGSAVMVLIFIITAILVNFQFRAVQWLKSDDDF